MFKCGGFCYLYLVLSEVILHVIVHVGTGFGQLMKYDGVEIFLHVSMFCIIVAAKATAVSEDTVVICSLFPLGFRVDLTFRANFILTLKS